MFRLDVDAVPDPDESGAGWDIDVGRPPTLPGRSAGPTAAWRSLGEEGLRGRVLGDLASELEPLLHRVAEMEPRPDPGVRNLARMSLSRA